jgi:hypothetical protein
MPEAARTLVKSPPELWAEVSDPAALTRHLGAFGEIRITRLEPETTVAWEGERASGTVDLEPTGWGTKVTVRADEADGEAEAHGPTPEPEPEPRRRGAGRRGARAAVAVLGPALPAPASARSRQSMAPTRSPSRAPEPSPSTSRRRPWTPPASSTTCSRASGSARHRPFSRG